MMKAAIEFVMEFVLVTTATVFFVWGFWGVKVVLWNGQISNEDVVLVSMVRMVFAIGICTVLQNDRMK